MSRKKKNKAKKPLVRRLSMKTGFAALLILIVWGLCGNWYVHHSRAWLARQAQAWPACVTGALLFVGNPVADVTDSLGWTGHDAVYEYDQEAPHGSITFAGVPRSVEGATDIQLLNRGAFIVGWSRDLRHPLWCAYHVTKDAAFEDGNRPSFRTDPNAPNAPHPDDYTHSGYDRGHMVPNHAIVSRYGDEMRRLTFCMSNIAPQSPALNRQVWRDVEHRIADYWTARYGEIWVVVGCIPSSANRKLAATGIDVPEAFYQVIVAQEDLNVRALAVLIPQRVSWNAWAARYIISIDELEELTGLDFNPDLPEFIQAPLEAELPSRLWPIRPCDIVSQFLSRYK